MTRKVSYTAAINYGAINYSAINYSAFIKYQLNYSTTTEYQVMMV